MKAKGLSCKKLIYDILKKYAPQKMEIGDIIRELKNYPVNFSGETVRREVADMTFHENTRLRSMYPCMVRHGDGVYSYDKKIQVSNLLAFMDDSPAKVVITKVGNVEVEVRHE